ncbi:hypothetical protein ACJX0J_037146, partial [Zea mays]
LQDMYTTYEVVGTEDLYWLTAFLNYLWDEIDLPDKKNWKDKRSIKSKIFMWIIFRSIILTKDNICHENLLDSGGVGPVDVDFVLVMLGEVYPYPGLFKGAALSRVVPLQEGGVQVGEAYPYPGLVKIIKEASNS